MAVFSNRATLTYNGISTDSNIVTGEIVEVLSAIKEATGNTYRAGESITYVISIVNTGNIPYTNLTVTDNLGAYPFGTGSLVPLDYTEGSVRQFVNGALVAAPAVTAGPPLVFSGINVPAGGNTVLVYRAEANAYAPLASGSMITNTATVTGNGLTAPVTASKSVTADGAASLTISKSLSPTTVNENGEITYTFVISNFGSTPVATTDNASITDIFDPILSDLSVNFDGTPWTAGNEYTYDEASGLFTTSAGQITVPAATYTQDSASGEWTVTPGTATLTVTGRV